MEYVRLGMTDLDVSRIGLGCEQLGGMDWGEINVVAAKAAVQKAVDLGINVFDTANVYGLGLSEERLSEALGEKRRDVIIVTKGGVNWKVPENGGRARTFIDGSPTHLVEALEQSLRRLRLDCIQLYMIHWPDTTRPIVDAVETLDRQRRKGKIRYIGLSNFSASQLLQAQEITTIAAVELQYSLLVRQAEEETIPLARKLGIGVIAYGVLAQGLLSGKYNLDDRFGPSDRRHRLAHFSSAERNKNQGLIEQIRSIAGWHGRTPSQLAIRWVLDQPGVSCAVVGAKDAAQVDMNGEVVDWCISPTDLALLSSKPIG